MMEGPDPSPFLLPPIWKYEVGLIGKTAQNHSRTESNDPSDTRAVPWPSIV